MNGNVPAGFDVHDYILRAGDQWQQEVNGLLSHLYMRRVFYYPAACRPDWRPVQWFHSLCDVFVYCDWMNRHDVLREAMQQADIPGFERVRMDYPPAIVTDAIRHLTTMDDLPWDIGDRDEEHQQPWGELVRLRRANGLECEDVWLVYFSGNPVTAYENLFTAKQTAPRFICLKHDVLFPVERWNTFTSPEGPLLTAIRANPHRTTYLLRDISEPPVI